MKKRTNQLPAASGWRVGRWALGKREVLESPSILRPRNDVSGPALLRNDIAPIAVSVASGVEVPVLNAPEAASGVGNGVARSDPVPSLSAAPVAVGDAPAVANRTHRRRRAVRKTDKAAPVAADIDTPSAGNKKSGLRRRKKASGTKTKSKTSNGKTRSHTSKRTRKR